MGIPIPGKVIFMLKADPGFFGNITFCVTSQQFPSCLFDWLPTVSWWHTGYRDLTGTCDY